MPVSIYLLSKLQGGVDKSGSFAAYDATISAQTARTYGGLSLTSARHNPCQSEQRLIF